jgi:hypothetical protein
MDDLSRLFFQFWSQFCPAFQEGYVPETADFPYLTYAVVRVPFGEQTVIGVNIYDRASTVAGLREIGKAIEAAIPNEGVVLTMPENQGTIWIVRGNPFIQSRTLPADEVRENIKSDYVNVIIRSFLI